MGRLLNSSSSKNSIRSELAHFSFWLCHPPTEHPSCYRKGPPRLKKSIHLLLSTTMSCERLLNGSEVITLMWKPSSYSTHNQFSIPYWTTRKRLVSLTLRAGVRHIKLERPRKRLRCRLVRLFLITCELYSSFDSLFGHDSNVCSAGWTRYTLYLQSISKYPPPLFLLQILNLCTPSSFLAHSISTVLST